MKNKNIKLRRTTYT